MRSIGDSRVSVIMATQNNQDTISDSIESIMSQSFKDWHLIIVDDCSSDSTPDVLARYRYHEQISLLRNDKPMGAGYSRNLAVSNTSSEYLAVLDADDISLPERLERQVEYLDANLDVGVVGSFLSEFGDWGGPENTYWPSEEAKIRQRQRQRKMPVPHGTWMVRKNVFDDVGGYDANCLRAEDLALSFRLENTKFACIPETLYMYRTQRPTSMKYVLREARYAKLALTRFNGGAKDGIPPSPPLSILTDARATITWLRRRLREGRS